eukprot:COSAG02_NODE_21197_length_798_cov_1.167382_1_plen_138_part_00
MYAAGGCPLPPPRPRRAALARVAARAVQRERREAVRRAGTVSLLPAADQQKRTERRGASSACWPGLRVLARGADDQDPWQLTSCDNGLLHAAQRGSSSGGGSQESWGGQGASSGVPGLGIDRSSEMVLWWGVDTAGA